MHLATADISWNRNVGLLEVAPATAGDGTAGKEEHTLKQ
jgi:hypothetical protein